VSLVEPVRRSSRIVLSTRRLCCLRAYRLAGSLGLRRHFALTLPFCTPNLDQRVFAKIVVVIFTIIFIPGLGVSRPSFWAIILRIKSQLLKRNSLSRYGSPLERPRDLVLVPSPRPSSCQQRGPPCGTLQDDLSCCS
jgi:hypothetical protein